MKLRFNRQEMADALRAICAVAAARTTKPVLRCVHIEAKGDVVQLCATDLEVGIRWAATQVEVEKPGVTLVVADTLSRIVSECEDEVLDLRTDENLLHLRGQGSHFQIVTQDPADFPPVPVMEGAPSFVIEQGVVRRLVERTVFACARESTRYAINGVLWEVNGEELVMAATDGRRLAMARGALSGPASEPVHPVIVPSKALQLLVKLPGDESAPVKAKLTANQIVLDLGRGVLSSSLVEGNFPKYQDVIPTDCDREARVNTAEFLGALKRAALLTNEESKGVRLSITDDEVTLSSRAPEQGEATVSIPIKYHGEPLEIGFNPMFLQDVLRVVDADEVTFQFKEPNRPGVIRLGEEFTYVVMPVNLASA